MPVWCRMSRCDDCTPDQLCDNCATHFRCDFCGGHDRWHRCPAPGEQAVIERGALPTTHSDFSTPQEALPTTDLPTSFRRERGARRLGAPISRRMLNSPVPFVLPRSRTYSTSENFTESDDEEPVARRRTTVARTTPTIQQFPNDSSEEFDMECEETLPSYLQSELDQLESDSTPPSYDCAMEERGWISSTRILSCGAVITVSYPASNFTPNFWRRRLEEFDAVCTSEHLEQGRPVTPTPTTHGSFVSLLQAALGDQSGGTATQDSEPS